MESEGSVRTHKRPVSEEIVKEKVMENTQTRHFVHNRHNSGMKREVITQI
jgi:hypothetical protein